MRATSTSCEHVLPKGNSKSWGIQQRSACCSATCANDQKKATATHTQNPSFLRQIIFWHFCHFILGKQFDALAIERSIILQGSSLASFSAIEKDVGVQFMSLQIFRTRFQLESRKLFSYKSPFPSSWGGPRVAERSSNQMFQEKLADRHCGTIYSCLDAGTVVLQSC